MGGLPVRPGRAREVATPPPTEIQSSDSPARNMSILLPTELKFYLITFSFIHLRSHKLHSSYHSTNWTYIGRTVVKSGDVTSQTVVTSSRNAAGHAGTVQTWRKGSKHHLWPKYVWPWTPTMHRNLVLTRKPTPLRHVGSSQPIIYRSDTLLPHR
jgi:hypothetical protein